MSNCCLAYTESSKVTRIPQQHSPKKIWDASYKITVHSYSGSPLFDVHLMRFFIIHKHGSGSQSRVCVTEVYRPMIISKKVDEPSPKEIRPITDISYSDADYIANELTEMAKKPNNPNNLDRAHVVVNKKLKLYRCYKHSHNTKYSTAYSTYALQQLCDTNGIPVDTAKHKIISSQPQPLDTSEWARQKALNVKSSTITIIAPEVSEDEINAAIEEAKKKL
jgi:hypothetical protein